MSPHDIRFQALVKMCQEQVRQELHVPPGESPPPEFRERLTECLWDNRAWRPLSGR
jgi:hypothetical protein